MEDQFFGGTCMGYYCFSFESLATRTPVFLLFSIDIGTSLHWHRLGIDDTARAGRSKQCAAHVCATAMRQASNQEHGGVELEDVDISKATNRLVVSMSPEQQSSFHKYVCREIVYHVLYQKTSFLQRHPAKLHYNSSVTAGCATDRPLSNC